MIKRVYDITLNENEYSEVDQQDKSLPSDSEVVCAVFCALLDYSVADSKEIKHAHYFDNNATYKTLALLKPTDLAIQNT